ncbi:MAG TPA: hypothetical protein VM432_04825 [Bdellovibrionales bacterium]|nr:hypothetical protein [Bdellovibrionales bacterium]
MEQTPTTRFPPLTLGELVGIAGELQTLVGAQLQECLQTSSELGLGFYHDRRIQWLWFDLDPRRPLVLKLDTPPKLKKLTKPLSLFIRSNFVGRRLKALTVRIESGRVLVLEFHRSSEEPSEGEMNLEIRLLPHGQNVIAKFLDKGISDSKPKDLPSAPIEMREDEERRTLDDVTQAWLALKSARSQPTQTKKDAPEKVWARAIEKKEAALVRMREELEIKASGAEREAGEWLKANGTLEVPQQWKELVDTDKSIAWNIQELFRLAKDKERKIEGTRARIELVESELAKLRNDGPIAHQAAPAPEKSLLERADAKGRRFKLAGDIDVYIGKSAGDNLALLRRAQPFDYWLHLRDMPGSHAILRRTRGRVVTDGELVQAAKWVVEQSLKKNELQLKGERYDVLIVECRFVKPIRGDKLGRVNYTNDRVLSIRF